jgi:hypothetical protein
MMVDMKNRASGNGMAQGHRLAHHPSTIFKYGISLPFTTATQNPASVS